MEDMMRMTDEAFRSLGLYFDTHGPESEFEEDVFAAYRELTMYREAGEGVARIAAERVRCKREEGWTPEHDARHEMGELSIAAACYALNKEQPGISGIHFVTRDGRHDAWPWARKWDKRDKHDRERSLEIAGQLIAAELDRIAARGKS